jgi:hypothetical protein
MLKLLCLIQADLSFIFTVLLVSDQIDESVWLTLALNLTVPIVHVLEGVEGCYVVGQEDGVGTSVEDFCDALEVLLACCVPNLQLNLGIFYFQQQRSKLNSHSYLVILHELVSGHTMHEA